MAEGEIITGHSAKMARSFDAVMPTAMPMMPPTSSTATIDLSLLVLLPMKATCGRYGSAWISNEPIVPGRRKKPVPKFCF